MIVLLLSCIVGSSAKNSSFLENVQASMVQEKDSDQSQDQPEIGVSALGYCVMNADTGETRKSKREFKFSSKKC